MKRQIFGISIAIFGAVFIFGIPETPLVFASVDEEDFSFSIDQSWYNPRDVIEITGFVNTENGPDIQLEVLNPNDLVIIQENITLDEFPKIEHSIATFGQDWNVPGFYQIRLTYEEETKFVYFAFGDFNPLEFEPKIFFDKDSYTWTDTVEIMVITPVDNQSANQKDEINIQISSSVGTLSSYTLKESENNNGIFSGEIVLTGHPEFDVDGDRRKGDAIGNTGGVGPDKGILSVFPNDEVTVIFSAFSEEIKKTVPIKFHKAQVNWVSKTITLMEKYYLQVIDPDMNLQPTIKNKVTVEVISVHQSKKEYTLRETENNNGIFEREIKFVNDSSNPGIFALEGSELFLKYEDRTLPLEYSSNMLEVISKATIIEYRQPGEIVFETQEVDEVMEKPQIEELPQVDEKNDFEIPDWIRNNAGWWAEDSIGDSDFVSGIQYLIEEGILRIPESTKGWITDGTQVIPPWIKNNAQWWAQGLISDEDFLKGIQYLIETGIIIV